MGEVTITQVQPANLHAAWPFVRRGVEEIIKKIDAEFWQEDVYASVRMGNSTLWIVSRDSRQLGYFNGYVQLQPFTNRREFFLWCVWNLPLRERTVGDNVPDAMAQGLEFVKNYSRQQNCFRIVTISPRNYEIYGFRRTMSTWEIGTGSV